MQKNRTQRKLPGGAPPVVTYSRHREDELAAYDDGRAEPRFEDEPVAEWEAVEVPPEPPLHGRRRPRPMVEPVQPPRDEADEVSGICGIVSPVSRQKASDNQAALLVEAERRYLGRQLHDSFGQQLTGMAMLVASLGQEKPSDDVAGGIIEQLSSGIEEAKRQLRALINGLTPVAVDADNLPATLEDLARDTQATYGVPCSFETTGSASLRVTSVQIS